MRVDKVWWREISERFSEEENLGTVKVGAVGIDGWDSGDRRVEGRGQCCFMGNLFETLRWNQQPLGVLSRVAGSPTLTASTHALSSASEMDLHSRLTRGFTH